MVKMKLVFKNIRYFFELSYSICGYWISAIFFKFGDYIDYLEIARYQLWHSSIANQVPLITKLKLGKKQHGQQIWVFRPTFTKIRNWFEPFSNVRGIAWDRGYSVNNIESRLVQTEYLFHLEKESSWLSAFQVYSLNNQPKRFYFYRRKAHGEDLRLGMSKFSQFIVRSRSVALSIYTFVFTSFFIIFLIFELAFLSILWVSLVWDEKLTNRFPKTTSFIKRTKLYYFDFFKRLFFYVFFFLFSPLFYSLYVATVAILILSYTFKDVFLFIYSTCGPRIFKFGFYFYRFFCWVNFYSTKKMNLVHEFFYHIKLICSTVFSYILLFYRRILRILFSPYVYILKHVFRVIFFIIYWHICSSIFFLFCYPTFLIITNFIVLNLLLGYEALLNLGYWSFFVLFVLSHLVPYIRAFFKIPAPFRTGRYGTTYVSRKFITNMNLKFYHCLNLQVDDLNKFKKWPLANEVLALRVLEEEETMGLGIKKTETLKDILKTPYRSKQNKIQFLAKHMFQLRENVATRKKIIFKEGDLGDNQEEFASIAQSEHPFKFYFKEFKLIQRNTEQIYQKLSKHPDMLLGVLPKLIYNSYINTDYYRGSIFQSDYVGQSNFVFSNSFLSLYTTKTAKFSKVSKNINFFIQNSAKFSKNIIFTKFDSSIFGYINKIADNKSSINWDIRLPPSKLNWERKRSKEFTFRATKSSAALFNFNSIVTDFFFNEQLIENIDQHDRNRYRFISSYVQTLYDLYWTFQINTNSFFSYSFAPEFYFRSKFEILNWLFKNSTTHPSVDLLYQDDFGSIINHTINSVDLENPSYIFVDILKKFTIYDKSNYHYFIIDRFNYMLKYANGYINFDYERTYSSDCKYWIDSTDKVFGSVKKEIDQLVENYLYFETDLVDRSTVNFINQINMPYRAQSAYSMYLHKTTAIGVKRYYITYKEKLRGIWADIIGIVKSLIITQTAEDKVLHYSSTVRLDESTQLRLDKASKAQVNTVNFIFHNFPIFQPDIIFKLYSLFIAISFFQVTCMVGPGSEYWYILFDFFLRFFSKNAGPFTVLIKY